MSNFSFLPGDCGANIRGGQVATVKRQSTALGGRKLEIRTHAPDSTGIGLSPPLLPRAEAPGPLGLTLKNDDPHERWTPHERWVVKSRPAQVNGAHTTEFLSLAPVLWTPHTESEETMGGCWTDN